MLQKKLKKLSYSKFLNIFFIAIFSILILNFQNCGGSFKIANNKITNFSTAQAFSNNFILVSGPEVPEVGSTWILQPKKYFENSANYDWTSFSYEWSFNGNIMTTETGSKVALVIEDLKLTHSGSYQLKAYNKDGTTEIVSQIFDLTINTPTLDLANTLPTSLEIYALNGSIERSVGFVSLPISVSLLYFPLYSRPKFIFFVIAPVNDRS